MRLLALVMCLTSTAAIAAPPRPNGGRALSQLLRKQPQLKSYYNKRVRYHQQRLKTSKAPNAEMLAGAALASTTFLSTAARLPADGPAAFVVTLGASAVAAGLAAVLGRGAARAIQRKRLATRAARKDVFGLAGAQNLIK